MGSEQGAWLLSLRAYFGLILVGNLIWETLQLPLYTIWTAGTPSERAFAVLHCTLGDLLIAVSTSYGYECRGQGRSHVGWRR